jgi:hypothetical protein
MLMPEGSCLGGVPGLGALVLYREWTGSVVAGASFGDGGSVSLPWSWLHAHTFGFGFSGECSTLVRTNLDLEVASLMNRAKFQGLS